MDVLKVLSLFLAITAISLPALGHQNTFHHDDPHIPRSVTVSNPDIEQEAPESQTNLTLDVLLLNCYETSNLSSKAEVIQEKDPNTPQTDDCGSPGHSKSTSLNIYWRPSLNIFNINGLQAISTLHTTSSDNQFYYAIINTVQDDVNDTAICKLQVIDDLTKTEGWNTVQLELNDQTKKNELYKAIAVDLEVPKLNKKPVDVLYVGTNDGWVLKMVVQDSKLEIISERPRLPGNCVMELTVNHTNQSLIIKGSAYTNNILMHDCYELSVRSTCQNTSDPHCMWHPKKCLCVSLRDPQYRDVKTFSSDDKCEIPPESTTNEPENTSPEIPEDDKEAFLYIIAATIIILVIATILILIVYFKMLQKLPGFLKKEEVET